MRDLRVGEPVGTRCSQGSGFRRPQARRLFSSGLPSGFLAEECEPHDRLACVRLPCPEGYPLLKLKQPSLLELALFAAA
jgi:hypothetical protein